MTPAEVPQAAAGIAGLAPWVQNALNIGVFVVVGGLALLGYTKKHWSEVFGEKDEKSGTLIAATLDQQTPRLTLETLQRLSDQTDQTNRILEELSDLMKDMKDGQSHNERAADRIERVIDRNTGCMGRLIDTLSTVGRLTTRD